MKRLVLIDGHALLHRAYHAFPLTLKTRKGELVNAVYGFTRILLTVLEDLKPDFLAVAFDLPQPTFRHREYVGYQIQRPEMDRELSGQIERVFQILRALNIPIFTKRGYEADDIIGTLARQASQSKKQTTNSIETIIVTGDRDMMQLVDDKIKIYAPRKGFAEPEIFDHQKVKAFLGVEPEQVVDYKALIGDASDNYPGVSGIGPKTAVQLLSRFKSLKQIYRNLAKIEPNLREKLIKGKENALLSKKLATIVTKVPLKLNLKACLVHNYDKVKAIKLFEELEFKSLIKKLPGLVKENENKRKTERNNQMSFLNDK